MSDIYLQITETPTVVTLSAPVISGALSSTVTVANTVTVALDSNSLSALENVTVTVGAAITGTVTVSNFPASQAVTFSDASLTNTQLRASAVTVGGTVTVGNSLTIGSLPAISGTVTANLASVVTTDLYSVSSAVKVTGADGQGVLLGGLNISNNPENVYEGGAIPVRGQVGMDVPISGTVTVGSALPAGTNQIGVVTIGNIRRAGDAVLSQLTTEAGSGYLLTKSTLNAGSEQIGSVTASISNSVTIGSIPPIQWSNANSGNAPTTVNQNAPLPVQLYTGAVPSSVTIGATIANSVTIGSLPAISGTVTANTFALQGTAVTTSNFTSTTASTVLASYNATREVLTIFSEGPGQLFVCAGATCTTVQYQVRLSSGDYYEVPNHQTTITHSAVFATAGTARICQLS